MLQQPRMRRGQGSHGRVAADTRPGRSWTPRPSDAAGRRSWLDGLTDTPGSVFPRRYQHGSSGHPSTDAVADALQQPTRTLGRAALKRALSGLAPGGVYLAFPVTREAGGLLHHRFTLTCLVPLSNRRDAGGLFSVALACGLPRVGVTHHPALRSPDVPRATFVTRGRLVNPSAVHSTVTGRRQSPDPNRCSGGRMKAGRGATRSPAPGC